MRYSLNHKAQTHQRIIKEASVPISQKWHQRDRPTTVDESIRADP